MLGPEGVLTEEQLLEVFKVGGYQINYNVCYI